MGAVSASVVMGSLCGHVLTALLHEILRLGMKDNRLLEDAASNPVRKPGRIPSSCKRMIKVHAVATPLYGVSFAVVGLLC